MTDLTILNTPIRTHGTFYCLNDLHKAAGGENRHRPSLWLGNQQTKELIEEIKHQAVDSSQSRNSCFEPIQTLRGGKMAGTYACKELVYAYAMWISAKFHLHVIRAFDAMVTGRVEPEETLLPSEQRTLMEVAHKRVADVADELKGKALAEIWSRLHNKFRIAKYSQLPRTRLADAIVYITQMDIKCAPRPEPEYLTNQDMANLRKIVGMIAGQNHYEGAWRFAIWKRLRQVCDCPSPNQFEVRHLPLLATELTRILAVSERLFLFTGRLNQRAVKEVIAKDIDMEDFFRGEETKAENELRELTAGINTTLGKWQARDIEALQTRQPLLNTREGLEQSGAEPAGL